MKVEVKSTGILPHNYQLHGNSVVQMPSDTVEWLDLYINFMCQQMNTTDWYETGSSPLDFIFLFTSVGDLKIFH